MLERFKEVVRDPFIRNVILVVVFVFGFFALVLLGLNNATNDQDTIDDFPQEGSAQDYSKGARIVNFQNLFFVLEGEARYDSLAEDLRVFGEAAYNSYDDSSVVVGFEITSEITIEDKVVSFEGKYGSSDNTVEVSLEMLDNFRQKASIVDTKNNFSIDDDLPSNSKYNQFLASLPIYTDKYSIEYLTISEEKIAVTLYERRPDYAEEAYSFIDEQSGQRVDRSLISMTLPLEFGDDSN